MIGGGAIGGYTAALLAEAGRAVTLCVRSPVERLRLRTPDGSISPELAISSEPAAQRPVPWLLVTTKAQDTPGVAEWLRHLVGPETVVALLQNGVDHAERLDGLVEPAAILPTVVYAPVERVAPGEVVSHADGQLVIPEGVHAARFRELFDGTGLAVQAVPDFRAAAWRKLLSNVAANPLTALTMRRMEVITEPEVGAMATELMREALRVARADGAELTERELDRIRRMWGRMDPAGGSSMLYDRLAGRPLEHEFILGPIVRYAERYGIEVPLARTMLTLLRALDVAPAPQDS
ncbi:ketopantoate reductase [Tamaricihabitans halophyticus]|uniref:2-dehydropantoate 2-reductase n=1 Tax=Tamaricihabitans halophyticus TaxID=1262583 RepID=A0A4R2R2T6_9PSEU|nr:ketopantoate reductase [Tamaricihabitans halophyticus]